ncbi:response regulator [Flavobacterium sp.]|uniref:response regulator n=1 Tax=Flavobacterium sp. TaxID=239 RepID=UPI003262F20A
MSKNGNILIVEDDIDDKELLEDLIINLGVTNTIIWKANGAEAFSYLCATTEPMFIVFSDINMPIMNGLELKRKIDADPDLRRKSIPFIFYSTTASREAVNEAYTELTIQGFFTKGGDCKKTKAVISTIIEYWKDCVHPNAIT